MLGQLSKTIQLSYNTTKTMYKQSIKQMRVNKLPVLLLQPMQLYTGLLHFESEEDHTKFHLKINRYIINKTIGK